MGNWIESGDRVVLAWEYLPLGTVVSVDRAEQTAIVKLDAPLPISKTGLSTRKLSDLNVLASAKRDRQGNLRRGITAANGAALNSDIDDRNPYADLLAQIDEALGYGSEKRSESFFNRLKGGIPQ